MTSRADIVFRRSAAASSVAVRSKISGIMFSSQHPPAAVDQKRLSGDEPGFVARQERDRRSHVLGNADETCRRAADDPINQSLGSLSCAWVRIAPGATALTVARKGANSRASARVKPITPIFAAT